MENYFKSYQFTLSAPHTHSNFAHTFNEGAGTGTGSGNGRREIAQNAYLF